MSTRLDPTNRYVRPTRLSPLTPDEKVTLLTEYFNHYGDVAKENPAALNAKVPRHAFDEMLHLVGRLLLTEASRLANEAGPVRDFLDNNPLPTSLAERLPPDFRTFCLAINALKQWVSAEQAATDRFLLGGTARGRCRAVAKTCIVTGETLEPFELELHHPVRDGRPPIPLSKKGHAIIENQSRSTARTLMAAEEHAIDGAADQRQPPTPQTIEAAIRVIKRNRSWVMLRRGLLDCLGLPANHTTPQVGASSKAFARAAMKATGLTAQQLFEWFDESGLYKD